MRRWGLAVGVCALVTGGCGSSSKTTGTVTVSSTTTVAATTTAQTPVEALISKTKTGIIRIESQTCDGEDIGTGFLLTPRLVATVEHVVAGATSVALKQNGRLLAHGTVVGEDPERDLALVRSSKPISGYQFSFAQSAPSLGEDVIAIGFPFGLPLTVTKGSVSGLGRTIPIANVNRRQLVQTDAPVNPGNSGGPLLASDSGQVVGLVDLGVTQANGISFAVSAAVASPLLQAWRAAPQPTAAAYCGDLGALSAPTTGATSTGDPLASYATSVAHVLEESAAIRKQLVSAIASASSDPAGARSEVASIVAARRDELASAVATRAPAGAEATQTAFVRAFAVSLVSDTLYQHWLDSGSASYLNQAQANDVIAVAAKARFLKLYNAVRSAAGLKPFPSSFPF